MAINVENAFDTKRDGFVVRNDDGSVGFYVTYGTADPTGTAAPINTWYFRTTGTLQLIYYKFGAGDNDWRQQRAKDFLMDVSTLTARSPDLVGATTIFDTLAILAARHFGSFLGIGRSNPNFQTTSPTYEDALVVNIPNARRGRYILFWSYRQNNSKSNTTGQTQARFNDAAIVTNTVAGQADLLGGGLGEQFTGFGEFSILDLANLKLSLAIQRTAGNGSARINTMNIFAFRMEFQ